jgi:hypothetical protein
MLMPVDGAANTYKMTPHPPADETFGSGVVLRGQWLKNGAEYTPFFIERGHVDVDQYFQFLGMAVDTLSITIPDGDFVTSKYGLIGFASDLKQTPHFAAYSNPSSNESMTSSVAVKSIRIDQVQVPNCQVQKASIDIKNNVKAKTGVGVLGACATIAHQSEVKGKLTMYFDDETQYLRLLSGTEFAFGFDLLDKAGNGYSVDMMRCQLDTDKINVSGVDNDVMDDGSFISLADNNTTSNIIISRFAA